MTHNTTTTKTTMNTLDYDNLSPDMLGTVIGPMMGSEPLLLHGGQGHCEVSRDNLDHWTVRVVLYESGPGTETWVREQTYDSVHEAFGALSALGPWRCHGSTLTGAELVEIAQYNRL